MLWDRLLWFIVNNNYSNICSILLCEGSGCCCSLSCAFRKVRVAIKDWKQNMFNLRECINSQNTSRFIYFCPHSVTGSSALARSGERDALLGRREGGDLRRGGRADAVGRHGKQRAGKGHGGRASGFDWATLEGRRLLRRGGEGRLATSGTAYQPRFRFSSPTAGQPPAAPTLQPSPTIVAPGRLNLPSRGRPPSSQPSAPPLLPQPTSGRRHPRAGELGLPPAASIPSPTGAFLLPLPASAGSSAPRPAGCYCSTPDGGDDATLARGLAPMGRSCGLPRSATVVPSLGAPPTAAPVQLPGTPAPNPLPGAPPAAPLPLLPGTPAPNPFLARLPLRRRPCCSLGSDPRPSPTVWSQRPSSTGAGWPAIPGAQAPACGPVGGPGARLRPPPAAGAPARASPCRRP